MTGKMKLPVVFLWIGVLCLAAFIAAVEYDWYNYDRTYRYYSSPFTLYLAVRSITLLLPGLACLAIYCRMKRKQAP